MQQRRVRAVALPLVAGGGWLEMAGERQKHCMQQTRVRAVALPLVAGWDWLEMAGERQQQIPFGNDN